MIPSNFNINFPYSGYAQNFNSAVFFNQNPLAFQHNSPNNILELLNLRSQLQRQLIQTEIHNLAKMNILSSLSPVQEKAALFSSRTNSCLKENVDASPMVDLPDDSNIRTEAQIKYMIQFFVNNHGIVKENEMQAERARYAQDKKLLKLFDALNRKYSSTTKTKEELIKWVIRRAIKSGKDHEAEDDSEKPLKKLHSEDGERASTMNDDEESHDSWIESLLPFKKSSKNKTMNSQFLSEIFASERFRADYHTFMGEIEKVIEEDTADKMRRFLQFVIDCVNKDTMEKIVKYRRVPWLKKWGMNARKIALQIKPKKNAAISHLNHY